MMKIPLFSKLTAKPRGRKVVRASAARSARGHDDYYEEEPNMKLSHAFMVVLILHVVAVGGIYAFNQINTRKNTNLLANISERFSQVAGTTAAATSSAGGEAAAVEASSAQAATTATSTTPATATTSSAATAPASAKPAGPAAATTSSVPAPGAPVEIPEFYTVASGDNPYTIARRFGISYQDLLTLNAIEDPTKLQIGQKLKMPRGSQ